MKAKSRKAIVVAAALMASAAANQARAESPSVDCGVMSGYQAGAVWPAYQGCSTHLGQSAVVGPKTGQLNWSKLLGGITRSPAIAKDNTIYVGSGAYLFALSPTGAEKWRSFLWNAIGTTPAIGADGTVYATSNAGALVAIDPSNGGHKWVYRGAWGFAINSSPVIDGAGTIYFTDNNNAVHAVLANGQRKWVQWFPGLVFSSVALARDEQTAYVGSSLFGVRAINTQNGQLRWIAFQNMGEFSAPTVGGDGTVYAGSSNGVLYAVNPLDGSIKWKKERKTLFIIDEWGAISVSPAIAPNGDIVFGTKKGKLIALTRSGGVRWERDLGYAVTGSPVIDSAGVIFVGTASKKVHAINPSNGADVWSYKTGGTIASAPALSAQGSVYAGSSDGYLHSVGIGVPAIGQFPLPIAPQAPWLAPLPKDEQGNDAPCPDCVVPPLPDHTGEVVFCPDLTIADDPSLIAHGYTTARPGLVSRQVDPNPNVTGDEHFEVTGVDTASACAAHLCDINANQLSAATESQLLSDIRPSQLAPSSLYVPCGIAEDRDCTQLDFRRVSGQLCAGDAECGAGRGCGLACPPDAQGNATADCDPMQRKNYCIGFAEDGACEGIKAEPDDAQTCFEVTECGRDEDKLDEADTQPLCDKIDAAGAITKIDCELLKQPLVDPNNCPAGSTLCKAKAEFRAVYPSITGTAVNGLLGLSDTDRCTLAQPETAGAADHGGSPSTPGKNKGKSKWGLDLQAGVDSNYEMKPLPFGLSIPNVNAGGDFGILATVMGRPITVLGVNGSATLDGCRIDAGAKATLFNNDISLFGGDSPSVFGQTTSSDDRNACDAFFNQVSSAGGKAKNALVTAAAVYNNVKASYDTVTGTAKEVLASTRTITQNMCKQIVKDEIVKGPLAQLYAAQDLNDDLIYEPSSDILYRVASDGTRDAVFGNPFCNRPLTQETAANVVNSVITKYEQEAMGIATKLTGPVTDQLNAYLTRAVNKGFASTTGGLRKELVVPPNLGQTFSLIGAEAVFPIGPVALVLSVQGTGGWAIVGGLDYGLNYDLAAAVSGGGGKIASAFVKAKVGPSAHVDVDVYVGVGFDFGIGGASVGIGGDITLVRIDLPVEAGVEAYVEKDTVGEPAGRAWPTELKHLQAGGPLLQPSAFRMKLAGNFGAQADMSALNGTLDLRLRVKLLFFKKTWKKQVASFKGFSKSFKWVVSEATGGSVKMPTPDLSVLPPIPFPKFPRVSPSDFPSLPSPAKVLTDAGENITGLSAQQIQAKFEEKYKIADKVLGYKLPDWEATLPPAVQGLYGTLKGSLDGKLAEPVECGPPPAILL